MMDDHDHHDTNVVNLRRETGLTGEEREQIAATIFAEPDEISTFSQGNLVPPASPPPDDRKTEDAADPFFADQLRHRADEPPRSAEDDKRASETSASETDVFFEQLVAQSATEMADQLPASVPDATGSLPGSARLPPDAPRPRSHRWRVKRLRRPRRTRTAERRAPRVALALATIALFAGAAIAMVLVLGEPRSAPSSNGGTSPQVASILNPERNPFSLLRSNASRHTNTRRAPKQTIRHHRVRASHAKRRKPPVKDVPRQSPTYSTSVSQTPTTVSQPTVTATQTPTTSSSTPTETPVQSSGGGSTNEPATPSKPAPAFGSNGTLGPGHSSIG